MARCQPDAGRTKDDVLPVETVRWVERCGPRKDLADARRAEARWEVDAYVERLFGRGLAAGCASCSVLEDGARWGEHAHELALPRLRLGLP